ncbi:hypothetical protein QNO00_00030 [Arthrobacter sp. zg-Y1219]|uniref:hypothetical protein n=1 Tax=Arthrobacter sp. zg-Y1219 TaxID=3049067 RepID=UPI0024C23E65|nr:hypothetical protein [Arthrobacter sp. zg-Y1219]MDK1358657.1 hypothetical protein [Arthrobacter sp. zg-Y1219]
MQFTALVVVLLGLAGTLVYGLVATQTREAAEQTLASAVEFDSPREAPLDVFLAVYDDGRLVVSRNMPSGLPDTQSLAQVAATGQDRRDTVAAGSRTYEVLTVERRGDVVQAAVDTHDATEQLRARCWHWRFPSRRRALRPEPSQRWLRERRCVQWPRHWPCSAGLSLMPAMNCAHR